MKFALKRSILFLFIALMIAFVLIPAYEIFVGGVDLAELITQAKKNMAFVSFEMWKRAFTFFLGLWCGNAIIWAISTGGSKPH